MFLTKRQNQLKSNKISALPVCSMLITLISARSPEGGCLIEVGLYKRLYNTYTTAVGSTVDY